MKLLRVAIVAASFGIGASSAARDGGDDDRDVAPAPEPRAPTVKLKLEVYPKSAKAIVTWGAKKLGPPPIELERPRGSGPLDLVIKADGYLEHHTRLFTDRNDRLSVSLRPTAGRTVPEPVTP